MQGLILAAGIGSRMGNIDTPKCLLEIDEIPIIRYQINFFKKPIYLTCYEFINDLITSE